MFRKSIMAAAASLVIISASVSPVLAQDYGNSNNSNNDDLLSKLTQVIAQFLNRNTPNPTIPGGNPQLQTQNGPQGMMENNATPGGMMRGGFGDGDDNLQTNNLTNAQKQAIMNELKTIRSEVESWAKTNNLDPRYIYRGLMGPLPQGQNGQQGMMGRPQGGPNGSLRTQGYPQGSPQQKNGQGDDGQGAFNY